MIDVGIIGCGQWGMNHVRVFRSSKKVRLKICCDKDLTRLKALHRIYPGLTTTTDHRKVFGDKDINAIVIATPTATHYSLTKAAILNGKHVLCEKPLAARRTESEELERLARKHKRVLAVGYVFLFNKGIIALKGYIEKGKLGKILYLNFTRTNLGPIRDDVDVTYDLASHDISIASFLLERWPDSASANAGFFIRKNRADIGFVTLYYPNSILVNIHVSWLDPIKVRKLTCVGDEKMAMWDDLNPSEPIKIFNKGMAGGTLYSDYSEFQLLSQKGEVVAPLLKLSEPLKEQNANFVEYINGKKGSVIDAVFGNNVTKVLEAIESSIKNKGRICKIS